MKMTLHNTGLITNSDETITSLRCTTLNSA